MSCKTILTISGSNLAFLKFQRAYSWLGFELREATCPADIHRITAAGVLLQGGTDVHPSLYGEEIRFARNPSPERDALEFQLLQKAHDLRLPVLGVCRGMQMMNVFYGGSLFQDIHLDRATGSPHWGNRHAVRVRNFFSSKKMQQVNSWHHQAVSQVAAGLEVWAVSDDDLVEAIGNSFLLGVQWHPENELTPLSEAVFSEHVRRMKSRRRK